MCVCQFLSERVLPGEAGLKVADVGKEVGGVVMPPVVASRTSFDGCEFFWLHETTASSHMKWHRWQTRWRASVPWDKVKLRQARHQVVVAVA